MLPALVAVLGMALDSSQQHVVATEACGLPGIAACTTVQGDRTIHSCQSNSSSPVTIGALNTDTTSGVYMCTACARPNQRSCECTHEVQQFPTEGIDRMPCDNGLTHWCLYEPQFVVTLESDGLYYCRHNASNTDEETHCGSEGKEACLGQDGSYSCLSPVEHEGVNITVTAVRAGTDPTLTVMCEACGKSGLPACKCSSLPPGTCAGPSGNAYYCEGDESGGEGMYLANDMLFCS